MTLERISSTFIPFARRKGRWQYQQSRGRCQPPVWPAAVRVTTLTRPSVTLSQRERDFHGSPRTSSAQQFLRGRWHLVPRCFLRRHLRNAVARRQLVALPPHETVA